MSAKQWIVSIGLAVVLAATGCRSWCERHYPCPTPVYAPAGPAPTACVPCAPTAGYAPAPPVQTWSNPGPKNCRCVCD
ncbi:MAG: hypothetical protein U0840_22395 [Gemmataceae bacterium]|jgi:hypothetical protein